MTTRSLSAQYFATAADLRAAIAARRGPAGAVEADPVETPDGPIDPDAREETPPVITWDAAAEGYQLDSDDDATIYATRAEALAALTETTWFADALERKRKPEGLAEPRWFDAAAVEDMPSASDGSQVAEQMIDDMVRNLAAEKTPITIDGAGVSEVHSSVYDSGVAAAGYGYVGVKLLDEEGRAHLYLYGACIPEVDERIDKKQMQWGSIAFVANATHRYSADGAPVAIGARLISYALTNQPFIDGLEPHASRANANTSGRRFAITRSRKTMATRKPTSRNAPPTQRGPMSDALNALAKILNIEVPAEMNEQQIAWAISDKAHALASAAGVEDLTALASGIAGPSENAARAGEPAAERAEGMPEDAAATEALALDMVTELRRLMGLGDDATAAAVLEALKAMADGSLAGEAPVDENAAEGGQPVEASRSDESRSEVIGLRAAFKSMETEVRALRASQRTREISDRIDERFRAAKIQPPEGEDRAELIEMCRARGDAWAKPIEFALRSVNVPAQGVVTVPAGGAQVRSVQGSSAMNAEEAIAIVRAELEKENATKSSSEKLSRSKLHARALDIAKQRYRDVLERDVLGDAD
ncbi:MAG: hypothetical protein IT379_23640 [Deltaproteobacteria bacterium]|nr:hypothetical protein [Deltaproteobacteria bacterium]